MKVDDIIKTSEALAHHYKNELSDNRIVKFELDDLIITVTRVDAFLTFLSTHYVVSLIDKKSYKIYTVTFVLLHRDKVLKMIADNLKAELVLDDVEYVYKLRELDNMLVSVRSVYRAIFKLAVDTEFVSDKLFCMLYLLKKKLQ